MLLKQKLKEDNELEEIKRRSQNIRLEYDYRDEKYMNYQKISIAWTYVVKKFSMVA